MLGSQGPERDPWATKNQTVNIDIIIDFFAFGDCESIFHGSAERGITTTQSLCIVAPYLTSLERPYPLLQTIELFRVRFVSTSFISSIKAPEMRSANILV